MKHVLVSCLLVATILAFSSLELLPASDPSATRCVQVRACFSPDRECAPLILNEIAQAKKEILIMAYAVGSVAIARALIDAHKAGIKVELLIDKAGREEGYTPVVMMANAGIPVWLDSQHAAMNNRVMILDGARVITGSYNFTSASETQNAENLLIVQSPELAGQYRSNWLAHRQHSEKY